MTRDQRELLNGEIPETTNPDASHPSKQRKMTRREKRDFKRKLAKPKYQKIAKRIIENKK